MMPLSNEIRNELSGMLRRFLEMLVPLQTPEEVRDPESEEELLRRALWRAARELDKLLNEGQLPGDLDLTTKDPRAQQLLYAPVALKNQSDLRKAVRDGRLPFFERSNGTSPQVRFED